MEIIYAGEEESLGSVESGNLNEWFFYEIEKIVLKKPDRTEELSYRIFVEGDWEADKETLEEARQYIKDLRESMDETRR